MTSNRKRFLELAAASTVLVGLGLTGALAQDTNTIRIAAAAATPHAFEEIDLQVMGLSMLSCTIAHNRRIDLGHEAWVVTG